MKHIGNIVNVITIPQKMHSFFDKKIDYYLKPTN